MTAKNAQIKNGLDKAEQAPQASVTPVTPALIELWAHQKEVVPKLLESREFCLFWEMGAGKTAAMIHGLRHMYTKVGRIQRTIIFAPPIVLRNWRNEFKMHSKIDTNKIIILDGSSKKRAKDFLTALHKYATEQYSLKSSHIIVITNYEAVQMDGLFRLFCTWSPEVLICDESHRLKNPQSKRAKKILDLSRLASRRYLLSGTPILNSALDIFMQYRILEGDKSIRAGATFGDNFYSFRSAYFEDKNAPFKNKRTYFPDWQPRQTAHVDVQRLIYRKASRVLKSECLDLPPLVRQTIEVELSSEQRRLYDEMKKDYIAFLTDSKDQPRTVVAQLALTKALRLQQICSGYVKTDDKEEIELKETPRCDALAQLLEDLTPKHKVIVWAVFKKNYRQIAAVCDRLKLPYCSLTGEQSAKEKSEQVKQFETDTDTRVIIANQGAGGVGINLVAASYSIFYSRNFSLEHDLQAEARNWRGGSERHVKITRIDLVAPATIDEFVLKALARKQSISDSILELGKYL